MHRAMIAGVGHYVPERIVTNFDLEKIMDTSDEWIRESTAVYPVENPTGDPYSYLWRIIPEEAGIGYGFYHTGLGVHLLAVLPDQKLVLVHRVDTDQDFDITWPEIRTLMEMIVSARGSLK